MLVQDEDSKQGKRSVGRITKVMPSRAGIVWTLGVKNQREVYTRLMTKIFKLEDTLEHVTTLERRMPPSSVSNTHCPCTFLA